jgi:hypothetical protein
MGSHDYQLRPRQCRHPPEKRHLFLPLCSHGPLQRPTLHIPLVKNKCRSIILSSPSLCRTGYEGEKKSNPTDQWKRFGEFIYFCQETNQAESLGGWWSIIGFGGGGRFYQVNQCLPETEQFRWISYQNSQPFEWKTRHDEGKTWRGLWSWTSKRAEKLQNSPVK